MRLKQFARKSAFLFQRLSSRIRTLPDFIVIGAQKSGTSSLSAYLEQHPDIAGVFAKEIHYFDGGVSPAVDNFSNGQQWYRANFPIRAMGNASTKVFEATPMYLYHPLAPERIHQLLPQIKLLVLLRNPTDRAISHYHHSRSRGWEKLPILEAMHAEESRIVALSQSADFAGGAFRYFSYKSRGNYIEQIRRYRKYFRDDQMLILKSEELFSNPAAALPAIFEFVGVRPNYTVADLAARNVSENKDTVPAEVYVYLKDFFRPHNQALYDLIGRDFGWQ